MTYKPGKEILALPRRDRRAIYHAMRKDNPGLTWDVFRRWDGGKPIIYKGFDVLKARAERKRLKKEAAATGVRNPISLALAAKAFLMRRKSPRRKGNA